MQNLPAILQTWKGNQAPPMPAMMPTAQPQALMPAPVQRPAMPAPVPQPIQALPSAAPRLKKEDVAKALMFIEQVVTSGGDSPAPVESVAMMAINSVDNKVLRALANRNPDGVISQLAEQDMLQGSLGEDRGKKYLKELLGALKTKLAS